MIIPFKRNFWVATGLSYFLIQAVPNSLSTPSVPEIAWQPFGSAAMAKSSGGRSRSGSFRSPSRSSRGKSQRVPPIRSSSPARGSKSYPATPLRTGGYSRYDRRDRHETTTTGSLQAANSRFATTIVLIGLSVGAGIVIFVGVYYLLSTLKKQGSAQAKMERERDNNIVAVSKLQVALLAYAQELQAELTALTTAIEPDSNMGRWKLLHDTLQVLLRQAEYWAYVESSSESMSLQKAEERFESLSLAEREKMEEVLTNLNGNLQQRSISAPFDRGEATFIVVTLILGTADDRPLFSHISTAEGLRDALKQLAAKRADYLKVVEVLWTPQSPEHRMPFDEFVMGYPAMTKLI